MINIGLISDTHGRINEDWKKYFDQCDYIFHTGDLDDEEAYNFFMNLGKPTYIVRGNCDRDYYSEYLPDDMKVPVGGKLFMLIHNRAYLPWDLDEVDFVIFGHTHIPADEVHDGIRFINPGSAGNDRGAGRTMAILHLDGDNCTVEKINL